MTVCGISIGPRPCLLQLDWSTGNLIDPRSCLLRCYWSGEKVTVATDDGFVSAIERELATVGEVLWEEASENLARG